MATQLVELVKRSYRLGCTPEGEPFAVPLSGPRVVRVLRGGRGSLRAEIARRQFEATQQAASAQALTDALNVIDGLAQQEDPEPLALRVAQDDGRLVLDLGDVTGRAVVIDPTGWQVVERSPVLFRRSALTAPLPEPVGGGDLRLGELWSLLNVREEHQPLLAALLVSTLFPELPHPVLALLGEQGTGKSTAAEVIASTVDPSSVPLRKAPKDVDSWTTAAAGSWVVALDNLSSIPDALSDALCRAVTGDGDVRRRLYTDGDLHVIAFRRVVLLNGIDLGGLRDDLADRLVAVTLERITETQRRDDAEVRAAWHRAHPRVLGALLDLAVEVLRALPTVQLTERPRMADFARVLAAVDQVWNTDGLRTYWGLQDELAQDAMNSDPVLAAITKTITKEWVGASGALLDAIKPCDPDWRAPRGWPTNARAMTGLLKRRAPSLRQVGWTVEDAEPDTHHKLKRFRLIPPKQREDENATRDTRNHRTSTIPAGHNGYNTAGERDTTDGRDTRSPQHNTRSTDDTRSNNDAVTSINNSNAGIAGEAGDESASSLLLSTYLIDQYTEDSDHE